MDFASQGAVVSNVQSQSHDFTDMCFSTAWVY